MYNTDKATAFTLNYRRKIEIDGIEIDGKEYECIAAAKDPHIKSSATVIRRRLFNPKYPTYKELTRLANGYKPVVIDGHFFDSYTAVANKSHAVDPSIAI